MDTSIVLSSEARMDRARAQALVDTVPVWHHSFEIFPGVMTPGSYNPGYMLPLLALPDDLSGKRVLDIGTSDGFFARALYQRGADVTCLDYRPRDGHGFAVMEELLGHRFPYHRANVYEIDAATLGVFDIVLFLGVLYHLPDMIAALRKVHSVCRDVMFLETEVDHEESNEARARYHVADSLNRDMTNFWTPNKACVRAMLADTGFEVLGERTEGTRFLARARAKWDAIADWKMSLAYGVAK